MHLLADYWPTQTLPPRRLTTPAAFLETLSATFKQQVGQSYILEDETVGKRMRPQQRSKRHSSAMIEHVHGFLGFHDGCSRRLTLEGVAGEFLRKVLAGLYNVVQRQCPIGTANQERGRVGLVRK